MKRGTWYRLSEDLLTELVNVEYVAVSVLHGKHPLRHKDLANG